MPRDVLALFGSHDLSAYLEIGRIALSPNQIYIHDNWNHLRESYDADVSLLEFDEGSIHFGAYIQPICLWESEDEPTVTDGLVTGWGKSEDRIKDHENLPKLVKALIQSNEDCFLDEGKLLDLSSRRTFCAGLRNGSGVCTGDSGGGLFITVDGVFYLKGIVSSSLIKDEGCDVSKNAVYTNVLKFKDWIEVKTGIAAVKKVFCSFIMTDLDMHQTAVKTCKVTATINSEDYLLGSPRNTSVEKYEVNDNRQTKFLPKNIGEKLPNLKEFRAKSCGLTVVRYFYFKKMGSLEFLNLNENKIAKIEPKSFDDLVSVHRLWAENNLIETLDEQLFIKMVKLYSIHLRNNKIKILTPNTFKILGDGFGGVDLQGNICLNSKYGFMNVMGYLPSLHSLESDIRARCLQ